MPGTASTYAPGIDIVQVPNDKLDIIALPVASGTIIARGDLVNTSSGNSVVVDAAGDNASYAGVSGSLSRNGDTAKITVYCRCIFNGSMSGSSTLYAGVGLVFNAGPATSGSHTGTTSWTFVEDSSGADIIAWANENLTSSAGPFEIRTDSFMVGVGVGSGAGFWEGPAA